MLAIETIDRYKCLRNSRIFKVKVFLIVIKTCIIYGVMK